MGSSWRRDFSHLSWASLAQGWGAGTLAESCCWGLGGRASQLEHSSPGQWPAALLCVPLTQVCGSLDRFLVSLNLGFPSCEREKTLISVWGILLKMQISWFLPYTNRVSLLLS